MEFCVQVEPLTFCFSCHHDIQVMQIPFGKLQFLEFLVQKLTGLIAWVVTDASDSQIHKPSFDYGHTLRIRLGGPIVNGQL